MIKVVFTLISILFSNLIINFLLLATEGQEDDIYYIDFNNTSLYLKFFNSEDPATSGRINDPNDRIDGSSLRLVASCSRSSDAYVYVKGPGNGEMIFKYWDNPDYAANYELIISIDDQEYDPLPISYSDRWILTDPFTIYKDSNEIHKIIWKYRAKSESSNYCQASLKSTMHIDDIQLNGLVFCSNDSNSSNANYSNEIPVDSSSPCITPTHGSLNDTYTYIINRNDLPVCSEPPSLEIKDPHTNKWQSFGIGKWEGDNITFIIPDLSFINPIFFGDIEFRLKNNIDIIIYGSKGPKIDINYRKYRKDSASRTIAIEVAAALCEENIYLQYDNVTYNELYTGCSGWQELIFGPIRDFDANNDLYAVSGSL